MKPRKIWGGHETETRRRLVLLGVLATVAGVAAWAGLWAGSQGFTAEQGRIYGPRWAGLVGVVALIGGVGYR